MIVQKIHISPKDTIIVSVMNNAFLTPSSLERIGNTFKPLKELGARVLIVPSDVSISVLSGT